MDLNKIRNRIKKQFGPMFISDLDLLGLEPGQYIKLYNLIMEAHDLGYADGYEAAERDHR